MNQEMNNNGFNQSSFVAMGNEGKKNNLKEKFPAFMTATIVNAIIPYNLRYKVFK